MRGMRLPRWLHERGLAVGAGRRLVAGLKLRVGGEEAECPRGSSAVCAARPVDLGHQLVKTLLDVVADAIDQSFQLLGVSPEPRTLATTAACGALIAESPRAAERDLP